MKIVRVKIQIQGVLLGAIIKHFEVEDDASDEAIAKEAGRIAQNSMYYSWEVIN